MFRKVLIANRGEIAVRVARTCRELGVRTVAVHSEADANALHVRVADEAIAIGPSRVDQSYLNVEALVAAVRSSGADAVHPGYGLLSEDADFVRAIEALGVRFVGPSPRAMEALGDKIRARAVARSVGLTHPPGTPEPLQVSEPDEIVRLAREIGFPVLVKAAAGGGGIGMQRANSEAELLAAVTQSRARSQAAFGDDRVYLERLLLRPRHLEVQVVADAHGNVRALGDRECSAQRRHQKVVEEAPAPAAFLTAERRDVLYRQAESLLRSVDYVGVGTVEFIADASTVPVEIHFLEVNARLQVEHPVTELTTGLDLVELQLRVAAGEPLWPSWVPSSDTCHAIEVRLYAEDPGRGFLPQPGSIERLHLPETEGFRVDAGYEQGDTVTSFYDPLVAKLIGSGGDRAEALSRLETGLSRCEVALVGPKGPRVTNFEFLRRLVASERFRSGDYDTHLIDDFFSSPS